MQQRASLLTLALTCLQLSDRICGLPQVGDAEVKANAACPPVTTQLPPSNARYFDIGDPGASYLL